MEEETNFNAEAHEGNLAARRALNNYANLLEDLCIKGRHDETTLKKQDEIGFIISPRDISPGNVASAFAILAQAKEDLGENFQWDGDLSNPWTMKIQKAYFDFKGGGTEGQSIGDMSALIQKRKQYLESLQSKVSDTSKFPMHEDDNQAADSLFYSFSRLQRIAETHSQQQT